MANKKFTIFAAPKPFVGHVGVIQANAVDSWLALTPTPNVVLVGEAEGVADFATSRIIRHIPRVDVSQYGTPLINSIFSSVESKFPSDLYCYINCDIILTQSFLLAIEKLRSFSKFLAVGERTNLDVTTSIDFDVPEQVLEFESMVAKGGIPNGIGGLDYMVYTPRLFKHVPPFVLGRPTWDNWMLYKARASGAALIDISRASVAVHQNHDYSHVPGRRGMSYEGPEADTNRQYATPNTLFTLEDATHVLEVDDTGVATVRRRFAWRHLQTLATLTPALSPIVAMLLFILHAARRIGVAKNKAIKEENESN